MNDENYTVSAIELGMVDTGRIVEVVLDLTRQRRLLKDVVEEFLAWSDMQANYGFSEVHNIATLRDMAEKAIECCDE